MDIEVSNHAPYGIVVPFPNKSTDLFSKGQKNVINVIKVLTSVSRCKDLIKVSPSPSLYDDVKKIILDLSYFSYIPNDKKRSQLDDKLSLFLQSALLPLRTVNKEWHSYIGKWLSLKQNNRVLDGYPEVLWLYYCYNNCSDITERVQKNISSSQCEIYLKKDKLIFLKMACKLNIDPHKTGWEGISMRPSYLDTLLERRIWSENTIKLVKKFGNQWSWNAHHLTILYKQLQRVDRYEGGPYIDKEFCKEQKLHRQKIINICWPFIGLKEKATYYSGLQQ